MKNAITNMGLGEKATCKRLRVSMGVEGRACGVCIVRDRAALTTEEGREEQERVNHIRDERNRKEYREVYWGTKPNRQGSQWGKWGSFRYRG